MVVHIFPEWTWKQQIKLKRFIYKLFDTKTAISYPPGSTCFVVIFDIFVQGKYYLYTITIP